MRCLVSLVLVATTLSACAPLQGPSADLHQLATPDPRPPATRPVLTSLPPLGPGRWRAWILPQTAPNGDVVEGHWLELSTAPPVVEVLEPVKPLPRAPKVTFGKAPSVSAASASSQPPVTPSPSAPVSPQAVVPDGLGTVSRGGRTPAPRVILGGP